MRCHLRPLVPLVILGFDDEARNALTYLISAKSDNLRLRCKELTIVGCRWY